MNSLVDSLEGVLAEAHKTKGWQFCQEPLWVTWSLEKFGTCIAFMRGVLQPHPPQLLPYLRSSCPITDP